MAIFFFPVRSDLWGDYVTLIDARGTEEKSFRRRSYLNLYRLGIL